MKVKSLGRIFLSIVLSLMVVYLVGGVTIVRCVHSDTTTIVSLANASADSNCDDGCDDDCSLESSCLKLFVKKLSSAVKPQPYVPDLTAVQTFTYVMNIACPCRLLSSDKGLIYFSGRHCLPPRKYLSLIRVLII